MPTGNEGATPADTEVTGLSPADDEQQPPEAVTSQEPNSEDKPSAPSAGGAEPVPKPANKYEG